MDIVNGHAIPQSNAQIFTNASNISIRDTTINTVGRDFTMNNYTYTVLQPPEDELREITEWLSPINFKAIQNDTLEKCTTGTGSWFLETDHFRDWLSNDNRTLWCFGMPGAGKTILLSIVIDHLSKLKLSEANIGVLFAYCRYTDSYTIQDIFGALLRQLVESDARVFAYVKDVYLSSHKIHRTYLSQKEQMQILQQFIALFSRFFILLDALDEFGGNHQYDLTKALISFKCNLLVTSRRLALFKDSLLTGTIMLEIEAKKADIGLFIAEKLEHIDILYVLTNGVDDIKKEIELKIQEKSNGMFLLAALQVEALTGCTSINSLRYTLEHLPNGVEEMYRVTMVRIEEQSEDKCLLAKRAIIWLTHAFRRLSMDELLEAVAMKPGVTNFVPEDAVPKDLLVSVSCGLITSDNENNTIRLIHYTAQDFFKTAELRLFPNPHSFISATCVSYLMLHNFCEQLEKMPQTYKNLEEFLNMGLLLRYAYFHWADHLRECGSPNSLKDGVMKFLLNLDRYPWSLTFSNVNKYPQIGEKMSLEYLSVLHIAACYGLNEALPLLDLREIPVTNFGRTPLHLASYCGHVAVVKELLRVYDMALDSYTLHPFISDIILHGIKRFPHIWSRISRIDTTDSRNGDTALSLASCQGRDAVVKLLLTYDGGIDVNLMNNNEETAIYQAARWGHTSAVKHLLARDGIKIHTLIWTDHNHHTGSLMMSLIWSSYYDNTTAIAEAAGNGHIEVVKLLLIENNEQLAIKSINMALFNASSGGQEAIVKLLLEYKDIDVNYINKYGDTALRKASYNSHDAVVKVLLTHKDINVNARSSWNETALISAGSGAVAELLLAEKGIEINAANGLGRTALIEASGFPSLKLSVMKHLLNHPGISVNLKDRSGNTALMVAAQFGSVEAIRLLIAFDGIDVNAKNEGGNTALMLAANSEWHEKAVEILLTHDDVDLNCINKDGETAFSLACNNQNQRSMKLVVDCHTRRWKAQI